MRLLLAEAPIVVGFLQQGFQEQGYDVHVASDGQQAITLGRSNRYHVIILASLLGTDDGFSVALGLRRVGQRAPILMLISAIDNPEGRTREAGADAYLIKPFRFEALLQRIATLADRPTFLP